jgi:branched-chain amino acid transport system substrate-binding protein
MVWSRRFEEMTIRTGICLALLAALSTACSLVVDAEGTQCESTSDCVSKGGKFAQSVCSPDKVCVPLLTDECIQIEPKGIEIRDDTLVVGFMSPIVGQFASNGIPQWQGVQLAVDEFRKGSNGLPLPDGSTRAIAVVGCHDFDDSVGVARHLVHGVGVPAILGPAFSGDTLKVATGVTVPAGVLLFPSSATSAAITNLNDKGLVWRTCPSDAIQAIPLAGLVSDMETKIRAQQPALSEIKVAITVKGDAYGSGLADAVIPLLKLNGKTADLNLKDGNLLRKDYPDPAEDTSYDFLPLVTDVIQLTPQIVLAIGTNETITNIMQQLEAKWPSGPPRPIYLFADGGRLDELGLATSGNADLRQRVLGTAPGRKTALYDTWAGSFQGFHGNAPGSYADNAYDSAYLLAFAVASLGSSPVTGAGLAEGLKQTVGGATKVVPGSTGLNAGFKELFAGRPIDYDGISGPLEFDVTTGEAPADIDIWCLKPGDGHCPSLQVCDPFVASGQYYDATLESVQGTRTACEPALNSGGTSGTGGTGGTSGTGGA